MSLVQAGAQQLFQKCWFLGEPGPGSSKFSWEKAFLPWEWVQSLVWCGNLSRTRLLVLLVLILRNDDLMDAGDENERERERVYMYLRLKERERVLVYVCLRVCVWEREREHMWEKGEWHIEITALRIKAWKVQRRNLFTFSKTKTTSQLYLEHNYKLTGWEFISRYISYSL